MELANETYFEEIIFYQSKFKKLGEAYRNLFLTIQDDAFVKEFSVQTPNFRFVHPNKTGKYVKEHILNY
jgi:hypothetical protein